MNNTLRHTARPLFESSAGSSKLYGLGSRDPGRLKKACQGVESLFVNMMLKEMRKSIPHSGLFPQSLQRDIYTSMFDQQIAQEVSEKGNGIGISDMLFEYLSGKNVR